MNNIELGKELKRLRTKYGFTIDQVANQINISKSTVSRYENGLVDEPKKIVLENFCRLYGVPIGPYGEMYRVKEAKSNYFEKRALQKAESFHYYETLKKNIENLGFEFGYSKSEEGYYIKTPTGIEFLHSSIISMSKEQYAEQILNRLRNLKSLVLKSIPIIGTISAGTPILAEENIEDYFSIDSSVKCDFALRVKGDSMINADIFDNDIVFIRKQNVLENGQIGAILLENEATLKRFSKSNGKIILQAENPSLTDWPRVYTEGDIRILGKLVGVYSKKE